MHILITGANGFIGKELVKTAINRGHIVYAIVNSAKDMSDIDCPNLFVIELLFDNYDKIASLVTHDIDIAYHLAWDGLSGQRAANVELQLKNVEATRLLLYELEKLNTKKLVFASSMNTLETINFLQKPLLHKARQMYIHIASKLNAEIISRIFCEYHNIEFNSAVLAMVYGENNKSKMITNVFLDCLIKGKSPKLIRGDNEYDIIYVKDVAVALYYIGDFGINKKRYYVGHNWNRTFKNIFTEVGRIVNPSIKLEFGTFDDDNYIDFKSIDREELTRDTGWTTSFDFEESIKRTADWVKNNYDVDN